MKSYIFLLLAVMAFLPGFKTNAQINVMMEELPVDLYARVNERQNDKGESLAVIKLSLPTLQNVTFRNNEGDVIEEKGEYIVYVSPDTESLDILSNGETFTTIVFSDFDITELKPKTTYKAMVNIGQLREIGFVIEPVDAVLTINGNKIELDESGVALFSYQPGVNYTYTVEGNPYDASITYKPETGTFRYDENQTDVEAISVILEENSAPVKFMVNNGKTKDFDVYIDTRLIYKDPDTNLYFLPVGTHNVVISAKDYKDKVISYTVEENEDLANPGLISVLLTKDKDQTLDHIKSRLGIYAGAGLAFGQKFGEEKMTGYPIRIGLEYDYFITRNFTVRPEIEGFIYSGKDFRRENSNGKKGTPFALDIAVPFNLNVPLSRFNIHFFSLGVGPMLGILSMNSPNSTESTSMLMYGGRVEARFYFNRFTFGASLDYQAFDKDKDKVQFLDKGIWVPTVVIGYMFK